ncbi:hypothetical protein Pfo_024158 [Paulownia fortunei]|nr:hypothetical protein Pfo_024158 [Paulownia fortunei]
MEEQLNSLAVTHLLQHTLRSLCIHENSQWVYAVFWRILPRNYPPPKWDSQGGVYDRSRGVRRNWYDIRDIVWEDGFCNFAASTSEINAGECPGSSVYGNSEYQHYQGLQPELFFKMSHEIYNYGEGLIGKVAADHSHKWIHKEPNDQEINFLSAWQNSADSHPRTWEAQFQSGIKTIALIAVREGVIQLGAVHKVIEDLSYVVLLRKKFSYIESIPGVLLPHPSSAAYPFKVDAYGAPPEAWHFQNNLLPTNEYYDHLAHQPMKITPSMSSLEALLSKLPSVVPASSSAHFEAQNQYLSTTRPMELMGVEKVAKEEYEEEDRHETDAGETSGSMPPYHHQQHYTYHHDLNVSSSMNNNGC